MWTTIAIVYMIGYAIAYWILDRKELREDMQKIADDSGIFTLKEAKILSASVSWFLVVMWVGYWIKLQWDKAMYRIVIWKTTKLLKKLERKYGKNGKT